MTGRHQGVLEGLGIATPAAAALDVYLETVAEWASAVNLTGASEPASRARVLVGAVLPAVPLVEGPRLLDVGSGNGSPGLVIAILRPELAVTLLEPRARRWAFLREAARRLDRTDIRVERLRLEAYAGVAESVSVRALSVSADELARLCAPRGRLLVMGRPLPPDTRWRAEKEDGAVHAYRRST